MIKGTTPTHTFRLPFDTSIIKEVMVIYAQNEMEVFHKDKYECEFSGKKIIVKLSQEETLLFNHRQNVQIQVRVLTNDDVAVASQIKEITIQNCLNSGVI